jgi:hypothetical protein
VLYAGIKEGNGWHIMNRSIELNKQIRNLLMAGVLLLLMTACGQFDTGTAAPAGNPEPMVVPNAVENNPTAVPAASTDPEQFRAYIGMIHPPLPEGLSEVFGMLIQDVEDHALTFVVDGSEKMLWLSKLDHYEPDGSAYWEVKDVLDLSNMEAGLVLLPDGCLLNGTLDSEILVAGKDGTVRLAWRANTTLDRFEVIPTKGIECHSDKAMDL